MDEARIVAWIDGELPEDEARAVAQAVAADPALAAVAQRHRALRDRSATAGEPIVDEPVDRPAPASAQVISLAAVRTAREKPSAPPAQRRNWALPGVIAGSLLVGLLSGRQLAPDGVTDRVGSLSLSADLSTALETQLSGQPGPVGISLSFRDRRGAYCRVFTAQHLRGVACKGDGGWLLRYGEPATAQGNDPASARLIATMIAGEPLDADQERAARTAGWK